MNPDYKDAPTEVIAVDENGFHWVTDLRSAVRYEMATDGAGRIRGYLRKDQADTANSPPSSEA